MDKKILEDYIDACENIKDVEKHIARLKKRKKTVIQTNVSGSNPEFPYEKKHFKVQGVQFSYTDEDRLKKEEAVLEERKANAEELKLEVDQWMNTIPNRMQRIIRYKIFEGMSWEDVAKRLGRKATGDSVRKEYENFFK
ncbi:MAG: sigma-70 family RNA polymerase sigma factor [Lachnospiraceae bacterium]|nr:sigma-70 family RNA polymerase sigma factor [Lachnospiraceae bacterium]